MKVEAPTVLFESYHLDLYNAFIIIYRDENRDCMDTNLNNMIYYCLHTITII